jgi:uncharacterized membrane protein (DUF485 family)
MNIYSEISHDLSFQKLAKDKIRCSWILSGLILISYYTFILVVAFYPGWLGHPINNLTVITWGIPAALFLIVLSMLMTAVYVHRCNGNYDERMRIVISRVEKNSQATNVKSRG